LTEGLKNLRIAVVKPVEHYRYASEKRMQEARQLIPFEGKTALKLYWRLLHRSD
jgi:hypothetical protein